MITDVFDPTVPEVRRRVVADMRRFRDWGMKLVKIDYLTNDWSFNWSMCGEGDARRPLDFPINHAFDWRDNSRTTAEVVKDLYAALREGALQRAFACASRTQPTIEPLDWTTTRFPCKWRTDAGTLRYNWEE